MNSAAGAGRFCCFLWPGGCWASSGLSPGPSREQHLKGGDGHWNTIQGSFPHALNETATKPHLFVLVPLPPFKLMRSWTKIQQGEDHWWFSFVSFLPPHPEVLKHFLTPWLSQHYKQSQSSLPPTFTEDFGQLFSENQPPARSCTHFTKLPPGF